MLRITRYEYLSIVKPYRGALLMMEGNNHTVILGYGHRICRFDHNSLLLNYLQNGDRVTTDIQYIFSCTLSKA
jgi:hypothetical protein